jgi:signal transduction histidine kinase
VTILGVVDLREIRREVGLSRAVFNRGQVALSILVAGKAFNVVAGGLEPWATAMSAAAVALSLQYAVNVFLVTLFGSFLPARGGVANRVSRVLSVGKPGQFLATYLGYGVLALVLAHLFARVGGWSVVLFLIPTLVARQMLIRGQALELMAAELRYNERLLERLVDRAVDERHDERLRIASDLHDDVLQSLAHIWFLAKIVERKAARELAGSRDIRELVQSSEASMESLRTVIHDLKESPLGRGGLVPTMKLLVRDLQLDWRVPIHLAAADRIDLGPESQVIAYQVAREAVLNALKHAKPSRIFITVAQQHDCVELEVEDDGLGFSLEEIDSAAHFGIGLMEERVRHSGGNLVIDSQKGKGTRLLARLPLEPRPEPS